MPRCPVIRPNGKAAIWSSIVDDFVAYDFDLMDVVEELTGGFQPYSAEQLGKCLMNLKTTGRAWKWAPTLVEAIETMRELHGELVAKERAEQLGIVPENKRA